MFYKNQQLPPKTKIRYNKSIQGETIEQKVERITSNKEPIKDGAPIIYTERKDGVMPEYDPRTDRFEIAVDAMDKVTKAQIAKRQERHKPKEDTSPAAQAASQNRQNDTGGEPLQAT